MNQEPPTFPSWRALVPQGTVLGPPWDRIATPPRLDAYAWAVVIAILALVARSLLSPWLETGLTAPFLLCAVAVTAYAHGFRPALVTMVVATLGFKVLFMGPRLSLYVPGWENRCSLAAVMVGCIVVAVLFQRMRRIVDYLHTQQDLLRSLLDVQEREKQFLCNEFHDGLVQYAVGARMLLESHHRAHPREADAETLQSVITFLQRGIEDGRRALRGIRPAVLDDGDLHDALTDLVDQFKSLGLTVRLSFSQPLGRLPEKLQTTVYRVVQEALNNCRRHSGVENASVRVAASGRTLSLDISDAGRGFDAKQRETGGFGLRGMAERIRLTGGSCTVTSSPGNGTTIRATLPLPDTQVSPPSPANDGPATDAGGYGIFGRRALQP